MQGPDRGVCLKPGSVSWSGAFNHTFELLTGALPKGFSGGITTGISFKNLSGDITALSMMVESFKQTHV